jgi:hypothetical protein
MHVIDVSETKPRLLSISVLAIFSNYFSVIVKPMGNHLAEVSLVITAPTSTAFALLRLRTPKSRSRTPLLKKLNGRLGSSKIL